MSNKEVLDFNRPEETKDFPVQIDGTSALKLDDIPEEQNRGKEIEEVRDEINATQGLTVVEPVNEEVIFEPIKDIDIKPSLAKRAAKFIKKTWLKIGTMFLASATLSSAAACGPIETAESTPEPTTITATQPAEVHVGDATMHTSNETIPEETPSPSPETTETPIFSEERTVELNQQIQDFLNKDGEYTEEKMSQKLIKISSEHKEEMKMGIMDSTPRIQGWLFDYFESEDNLLLIIGLDNKNDERFVTLLQIPTYFYDKYSPANFIFTELYGDTFQGNAKNVDPNNNSDEMKSYLDRLKDGPIIFTLRTNKFPDRWSEEAKDLGDFAIRFVDEGNSKVDLSKSLIAEVSNNNLDFDIGDHVDTEIISINESLDINNIDMSKVVRLTTGIIFGN